MRLPWLLQPSIQTHCAGPIGHDVRTAAVWCTCPEQKLHRMWLSWWLVTRLCPRCLLGNWMTANLAKASSLSPQWLHWTCSCCWFVLQDEIYAGRLNSKYILRTLHWSRTIWSINPAHTPYSTVGYYPSCNTLGMAKKTPYIWYSDSMINILGGYLQCPNLWLYVRFSFFEYVRSKKSLVAFLLDM